MSTFGFNKIFILESLLPNELQTGTELERRINAWAPLQGINCQVVTFPVHSMLEWEAAWNGIYTSITQMGNNPIIHLEMHGNKTHVGIDKGRNGTISLIDVFKKVQKANILSHNNTFLSLAVCEGLNVIRSLGVYEPMPFCGVMGSEETLGNQELLENYTIFYKAFLKTLNLDAADATMKAAGIDASKYKIVKPELVFMNAYLGYLESYNNDIKIVERAKHLAELGGMNFSSKEVENRWIRDCRCSLLMTENEEYQKAINQFFMFDKYPEIRERFQIKPTIYEFREYAAQFEGNEWVNKKRPLTDDDIKGLSIQILHYVDEFCKKNKIKYSLAYGTLIGAIRHKGFIPWDDDIDIMMLREDYNRFVKLFNQDKSKLFSVESYETNNDFPYPLAKVFCNATVNYEFGLSQYGFGIDVFPIDKIPMNENEFSRLIRIKTIYWNLFLLKSLGWNRKRKLRTNVIILTSKILVKLIPYSFIHKQMHRVINKYTSLTKDYLLGNLISPYGTRDVFDKDIFNEYILLQFDGQYYYGIKGYDTFLTKVYGEYMKCPPKEAQVTHHEYIPYWK